MRNRNGQGQSNGSPERDFFDRAVRLENEKAELVNDLKALWDDATRHPELDAKAVKALKRAVKIHCTDPDKLLRQQQTELDAKELLLRLGFLATTPLGRAAMNTAGAEYDPETGEVR